MKRLLIVLALALTVLAQSCMDPEPAEISVIAFENGNPRACMVNVFNANHKQVQQVNTDGQGLVYIKQLAPGTYHLEFATIMGEPYPAKATVDLKGGDSLPVRVELTEAAPAEPTT
jgi:hypothetical protein